jgi:hypothetical protein
MNMYDQNIEDYVSGFNHAVVLAEYEPEVLADSPISHDEMDDFAKGFAEGKEHIAREQQEAEIALIEEMMAIRNSTKERDNDLEL